MDLLINQSKSINEMGFCIPGYPKIPSAEMRYERIEIDGRDGELLIEKGYSNITYTIPINALEDESVKPLFRDLKYQLRKAQTILLTDDRSVFYKVKRVKFGDIENELEIYGYFEVEFELAPHEYFADVSLITVTTSKVIKNEGLYFSQPKFTIYGNGECKFKVNGLNISVKSVSDSVVIDSEIEECYKNNANWNNMMVGDFPIFEEGENTVEIISGASKIEIEPRWRAV